MGAISQENLRRAWREACEKSHGKLWSFEEAATVLSTDIKTIKDMADAFVVIPIKNGEHEGFPTRLLRNMRLALDMSQQKKGSFDEYHSWLHVKLALPVIMINHMFDWVDDRDAFAMISVVANQFGVELGEENLG